MAKLSLGQAAKAAGVAKTTLRRMLDRGEVSGAKGPDGTFQIDQAEIARAIEAREAPGRGRSVKTAPVDEPAPEAIEAAVLRAQLEAVRDRLADAIKREEAAEERAAEALRRERQASDRLTRLIEDQRPQRGLWARLTR